ncbi:hypothetical protein N9W41_00670 [bacterium]|nr:hypothetical protein [bacterium]
MKKIAIALISLIISTPLFAAGPTFDDIDAASMELIVKDFSAAFDHTMMSSATPLGDVFGLEMALIVGAVNTKNLDALTKAEDPTASFEALPVVNLEAAMSFPMGITAELNYLPSFDADGTKFDRMSLGVKWTLTQNLLKLPFDLAVRGYFSKVSLSFTQSFTDPAPTTADITFDDTITGVQAIASKSFGIVEPYAGLGFAKADGKLSSSTSSIFAPGFTLDTSAKAAPTSVELLAGAQFNLFFFKAAVEYASLFGSSRMGAKLGVAF